MPWIGPEARIIFTRANADTAGRIINRRIDAYVQANPNGTRVFTAMGSLLYLSAVKHVDMIVGNSSSGIVEAPVFRKPVVNLGKRQEGRLKAASIIDCEEQRRILFRPYARGCRRVSRDRQEGRQPLWGGRCLRKDQGVSKKGIPEKYPDEEIL
jgi:UDP-N-acetylglucosamine 2-epimerase (non-hydrolysing)/GDP/UDP-N,N'-diacetylbacillosamine 2-epimerase (hydrolysing)